MWTISLKNKKRVKTRIHKSNIKTTQFALSYKWHSPALNFAEYILSTHIEKNRPWIDVGANLGLRSLLALSEQRPVYMFEPNRELNNLNKERCNLNNFSNFSIIDKGVSNITGKAEFYVDKSSYNSSLNVNNIEGKTLLRKEVISLDTIDNLFSNLEIPPACIKIDVEGHELEVIEGGCELIRRWLPPLIVEVNITSGNFAEFKFKMIEFGYTVYQIKDYTPKKFFSRLNLDSINEVVDSNDFLALKDKTIETIVNQYCVN